MVLDAGEVKEYAPPQELLADEESIFYSLAKQANLVSGSPNAPPTPPTESQEDSMAAE